MLAIRRAIKANILPAGTTADVFYEDADDGATFPYIVYSFEPIETSDESASYMILDIDGWDAPANGDTEPLEALMEKIDGDGSLTLPTGMNEKVIITDEVTLVLRRSNRYPIPQKDKKIKRRRYTYQVTIFERSPS